MITLDPDDNISRQGTVDEQLPSWMTGAGPSTPEEESDSDRPTIGQRIGARPGMYAPPSAPAAEAPPMPPVQFDPNKIPESIRPRVTATDTAPPMPAVGPDASKLPQAIRPQPMDMRAVPGAPIGVNNDQRTMWTKKLEQDQTPLNAADPKYKQGIGTKVLGTAANFLQGFGRRPFTPTYVGPDATNARYSRDEATREQNVAKDQAQLGEQEKLDVTRQKTQEDLTKQIYQQAIAGSRGETADARAATAAAQQETADVRRAAEQHKENTSPSDQRATDADKYGLTGQARKDYILTGKLPKDFAGAGRAPTELEMWSDAFKQQYGRAPNADEITNRRSHTDTRADQITKDRDTALEKAEQKARERLDKLSKANPFLPDPTFPKLKGESADQYNQRRKQAIYADLEKDKAAAVKDYQERAAQNASRRGPAARPGAAPSRAASKIDPNNLPKTVIVGGKTRNVAGYNKQTGRVILAPEGQ